MENDMFGEISVLYGCQATASVVGHNYALLGTLSSSEFNLLTIDFPELKEAFKERVAKYNDKHKRRFLEVIE